MLSVSLYFIDNSIFSDSCLQSSIQTFKKTSFFYTTQKSLSTEPPLAMYNPDFFKSKREGKKIKVHQRMMFREVFFNHSNTKCL